MWWIFGLSINGDYLAGRPFGAVMKVGDDLYLSTNDMNDAHKQMREKEHIQIVAKKAESREWIRITGIATECDNQELKQRMLEEHVIIIIIYINLRERTNKVKFIMGNCICSECIKDSNLKRYIVKNGSNGVCNMCGEHSEQTIKIATREFQNRMKAAIRYNYSEILYNSHWGGMSNWVDLLEKENLIFKLPIEEPNEVDEDALYWEIYDIPCHIKDYSKDVSLYFGGERLDAFFDPIMRDRWSWIRNLSKNIGYNNPNIISKEISDKIKDIITPLAKEIEKIDLYRARIGIKDILTYSELGEETQKTYIPYKKNEIGAPWPRIATEGRFNRAGTSYLYLASNLETAINEIRPSVGHCVSIGKFRIEKKVNIVDFSNLDFYDYATSDDKIDEYVKLKSIEEILCIPNPDKEYRLTQGFSDAFILLGYDGIKFKSSVSYDTYNIVLFNRSCAEYIDGTHKVVEIKGLKYDIENKEININKKYLEEYISQNNAGHEYEIIRDDFGIDIRGTF